MGDPIARLMMRGRADGIPQGMHLGRDKTAGTWFFPKKEVPFIRIWLKKENEESEEN